MTNEAIIAYRTDWLIRSFFRRKSPSKAVQRFRRLRKRKDGDTQLHCLLRHHGETVAGIGEPEIYYRDEFDFLLAYYSLRELAAVINYVPLEYDSSVALAEEILNHPAIVLFSEQHYPLLLPSFARERLNGKWTTHESAGSAFSDEATDLVVGVFEEFLQLLQRRYADREIDTFLWFLDDGYLEGESLADTIEDLGNPAKIEHAFSLSYRKRSHTEDSIVGFVRFIRYSQQLLWLLEQLPKDSLIQSGLWHYHVYWFTEMAHDFRAVLASAIQRIEKWAVEQAEGANAVSGNRMMQDIERLFDPAFGRAYLTAAKGLLSPQLVARIDRDMRKLPKRAPSRRRPA